jgi:heme O synthase-like polyprenyltransferase
VCVRRERDENRLKPAAARLFGFSVVYLFIIFAGLLIDGGLLPP